MYNDYLDISLFKGKVIKNIEIGDESMTIELGNDEKYSFYHSQDCCESVRVNDVLGDPKLLIGKKIVSARDEILRGENPEDVAPSECRNDSWTWTTYYFETKNSKLRVRFLGESNGYYSEDITIAKV